MMRVARGELADRLLRMAKARWRNRSAFQPYRDWDVWCVDGIALLFKRGRCLRMYWDEFRTLKKGKA